MGYFLLMLVVILVTVKLADHFCSRMKIPIVIGELLAGILLGPAVFIVVQPKEEIHLFSEIGVILLMFLAGLESDLPLLKKHIKSATGVAVLGIIFPFVFITAVGQMIGLPLLESSFLGVLFSATSVSISVQVLREYKKMQSTEGTVILGAAVLDDILVVLLVSIFISLTSGAQATGSSFALFWELILNKVLFFILLYLFVRFAFKPLIRFVDRLFIFEGETAFALFLCFFFSILAGVLGMSYVIGAFFAGVLLSTNLIKEKVLHNLENIGYQLFIPVFFVSIGLSLDLAVLSTHFGIVFVFTIVAFLTKLLGGYFGARMTKIPKQGSWLIGSGMVSRGEMALIIAQMGLVAGLMDETYFSVAVLAVILTTVAAPFAMKKLIV